MTLIDTLGFWDDHLGTHTFNPNLKQSFTAWYRVPDEWVVDGKINDERREVLFRHIYGDTWRMGNPDGSKYIVLECDIHVLTPSEAEQRPWVGTTKHCYVVTTTGTVEQVDPEMLYQAHLPPRDDEKMDTEAFGCANCWPASANLAWAAFRSLSIDARLVDESHFTVVIRSCAQCRQRFVSVFTETVDWTGGEDSQYWIVLPITEQEVVTLAQAGSAITSVLDRLAPQRRSLRRDFPGGERPTEYWGYGILVGPHD